MALFPPTKQRLFKKISWEKFFRKRISKVPSYGRMAQYAKFSGGRRGRLHRIRNLLSNFSRFSGSSWRGVGIICIVLLVGVTLCYGTISLIGYGVHVARVSLEEMRLMPVEHFEIIGNDVVTKENIREVAQILEHKTGMLGLDIDTVKSDLENMPWIKSVKIERDWPSTVIIHVEEESVFALLLNEEQQLYYMDNTGKAFLAVHPGSKLDFPVVTGLSNIADIALREKVFKDVLILLQRLWRNNPYLPVQSLSEIHLTAEGEMVLYLVEYPFPIFFGKDDIKKKYWRLVQIFKPLYKSRNGEKRIENVAYIQMEYLKDKVLVSTAGDQ